MAALASSCQRMALLPRRSPSGAASGKLSRGGSLLAPRPATTTKLLLLGDNTTTNNNNNRRRRRPIRSAGSVRVSAAAATDTLPFRVGHGWDLHRLEEGYPLIIGGVDIPHTVGCVAHSDGA